MAQLELIKYGHPTLRKVAEPCDINEIDQKFIDQMLQTMQAESGAGLAAPQVNVSKRIVTATDLENTWVLINPKIIAFSESIITEPEGCLSLPDLQAVVERYEKVVVQAYDRNGKFFELKASKLLSRAIQHEIDHLNGVLYIDRAKPDSLVWLRPSGNGEDLIKESTTIAVVQNEFRKAFNKNVAQLVFDAQKKA
jgi:peptide deformylase